MDGRGGGWAGRWGGWAVKINIRSGRLDDVSFNIDRSIVELSHDNWHPFRDVKCYEAIMTDDWPKLGDNWATNGRQLVNGCSLFAGSFKRL